MITITDLEQVSKYLDLQQNGPHHIWSPWGHEVDYDALSRFCKCGVTQRVTGPMLAQIKTPQEGVQLLEHIWANTPPHSTGGIQSELYYDAVMKAFPGATEETSLDKLAPPDPPEADEFIPELTEDSLEKITEWMNTPIQEFVAAPAKYWELYVVMNVSSQAGELVKEGDAWHAGGPLYRSYYTTIVERYPINLQDDRYYMEVAIRRDTGEPLVTVNHRGSFQSYMTEIGEAF
jgi:hypothetical protein